MQPTAGLKKEAESYSAATALSLLKDSLTFKKSFERLRAVAAEKFLKRSRRESSFHRGEAKEGRSIQDSLSLL
jgi:hypothetical protein